MSRIRLIWLHLESGLPSTWLWSLEINLKEKNVLATLSAEAIENVAGIVQIKDKKIILRRKKSKAESTDSSIVGSLGVSDKLEDVRFS